MLRDISLHITDIIQNSITAGAGNVKIEIRADKIRDSLTVAVMDDGCGMKEDFAQKAADPFTTGRSSRKVGLGIPFFKMSGEITGGSFSLSSREGEGTSIIVEYKISSIDRIPLGDVGDAIVTSILTNSSINFELFMDNGQESFYFSSRELSLQLKDIPLTHRDVLAWIRDYINENVVRIFQGILEEIH